MQTDPDPDILKKNDTTRLYKETLVMNEALMLGSVRQHELTEAAENLNSRLEAEIEARLEATRELAEKARLLDLSNDAIIVRDIAGRILYWNRGAEELYGWSQAEALGKMSHTLLQTHFAMPIEQMTEELYRNGRWTGELTHTRRDGQRLTVLARKSLDRDSEGKPLMVLQTITDISERKQMEVSLLEAQTRLADHAKHLEKLVVERTAELTATNQQLEAFVYSIAHDLRAPLRAMEGFSSMLVAEAGSALSDTGKGYATRLHSSARFMDAMLRDLVAFSRISQQEVTLRPVELRLVVDSVLAHLETDIQEKHARVEIPGPWRAVLAHEATLTRVLFNLVGNALKFTTPGVTPVVRLWTEDRAGAIRIWVEDNGPGIAPEHQRQIFQLFTRLDGEKYTGTGLGLAIVQKGVERMSGGVGVESTLDHGCRFWFELRNVPTAL